MRFLGIYTRSPFEANIYRLDTDTEGSKAFINLRTLC